MYTKRVSSARKRQIYTGLKYVTTCDIRPYKSRAIGNVVLFHGYRGRMAMLWPLMDALAQNGFNVFACDLPNHGTSVEDEKKRGMLDDFEHYVRVARIPVYTMLFSSSRGHLPTYIVGYSLGALIALHLLETKPLIRKYIQGAVLISTPLMVDHNLSNGMRRLRVVLEPLSRFLETIAPNLPVDSPTFAQPDARDRMATPTTEDGEKDPLYGSRRLALHEALEFHRTVHLVKTKDRLKKIWQPIQFIHGSADPTTPLSGVLEVIPLMQNPITLTMIHGAKHELLEQPMRKKVIPATTDFLTKDALTKIKKS